jgi:hypothetical protein
MIDQLIHLCRIYHQDETFRNLLESKYFELAGDLDDSEERFFINNFCVFTEKTRDLCRAVSDSEFPQVELRYQINKRGNRFPDYGEISIPYDKQFEGEVK